jgi:hypothetical protein
MSFEDDNNSVVGYSTCATAGLAGFNTNSDSDQAFIKK